MCKCATSKGERTDAVAHLLPDVVEGAICGQLLAHLLAVMLYIPRELRARSISIFHGICKPVNPACRCKVEQAYKYKQR